ATPRRRRLGAVPRRCSRMPAGRRRGFAWAQPRSTDPPLTPDALGLDASRIRRGVEPAWRLNAKRYGSGSDAAASREDGWRAAGVDEDHVAAGGPAAGLRVADQPGEPLTGVGAVEHPAAVPSGPAHGRIA